MKEEHNHYFKPCPYDTLDVYRVISIFGVTDPCIQHALKKLLCSGVRGHKDQSKDIQDVIDTLERWKQMREEDAETTFDSHIENWYPDNSGKWIEYDGSGQPVEDNVIVDLLLDYERVSQHWQSVAGTASGWNWGTNPGDDNIVAYKIVE